MAKTPPITVQASHEVPWKIEALVETSYGTAYVFLSNQEAMELVEAIRKAIGEQARQMQERIDRNH